MRRNIPKAKEIDAAMAFTLGQVCGRAQRVLEEFDNEDAELDDQSELGVAMNELRREVENAIKWFDQRKTAAGILERIAIEEKDPGFRAAANYLRDQWGFE